MPQYNFKMVFDSRNRRVRGLWIRGGIYYAQLRVDGKPTRVRLQDADKHDPKTVPQALVAMQELLAKRRAGELESVTPSEVPTLEAAIMAYFEEQESLGKKRASSLSRERSCMNEWNKLIGGTPVNEIGEKHGVEFALGRKADGISGRSIDIAIVAIRNVLKRCRRLGHIKTVPFGGWERMAAPVRRKRLVELAEVEKMCAEALKIIHNHLNQPDGQQFADYLRLLALTGAREREALHLRWEQVDFERKQLEIGRSAFEDANDPNVAKNRSSRVMPMSPPLKKHLKAMAGRKRESKLGLLFPSPHGGGVVTSYKKSLARVKEAAGVEEFGWHHLRHYFISHAVMSGIDYRTIAEWVGHRDGGVLIGKTYSHLRDEHSQAQAKRLKFG